MTITAESSLVDVAFAVCTALDRVDTVAVLTGGSAATYYCPERYQSLDVDFVLRIAPARRVIEEAMAGIGFIAGASGMYAHGESRYTVEFPRGPLSIGRDVITSWATERRDDEVLYITSVTDCVRDRFMHFWAWNDRSALDVALAVATAHREAFAADAFLDWAKAEREADRSYQQEKVDEFMRRLTKAADH